MQLAIITGTVTATAKDPQLVGLKLLVADVTNERGEVLEPAIVVADACGAGQGDQVIIARGSSARMPKGVANSPVDASAIAIVEHVSTSQKPKTANHGE